MGQGKRKRQRSVRTLGEGGLKKSEPGGGREKVRGMASTEVQGEGPKKPRNTFCGRIGTDIQGAC